MTYLSWKHLFEKLRPIINGIDAQAVDTHRQTIISLLNRYNSIEDDFRPYLFFDESGYTKNLVEEFGKQWNVIVMCWAPKQSSAFHGHEGSKCFVKVLSGELIEQQVPYPIGTMKNVCKTHEKEKLLTRNDVSYIDDSIGLHKIANKSSNNAAVTLHIYMPSYTKCRIFESDSKNGNLSLDKSKPVEVNFYSKIDYKVI